MSRVQNNKTPVEVDVQDTVDEVVVNTVYGIFNELVNMNPLQNLFDDLTDRLATELYGQSILEFNLELSEDQKKALTQVVRMRGNDTVKNYLQGLEKDKRATEIYALVKEKTAFIADSVLRSIGQVINRGAIINAIAVQANAKGEEYNEILLRTSKGGGDITIPTNCVLISTNCVSVIQKACRMEAIPDEEDGEGQDGTEDQSGDDGADAAPEEKTGKSSGKGKTTRAAADKVESAGKGRSKK
ncbi:hypothetical protein AGMMS4952_11060 [Spirochaetia bacterium]|nr:hypothetical protein AGMMS4952_11060 [Spirochaetia bacterium]